MSKWKISGVLLLIAVLATNIFAVQSNAATFKRIEGTCLNGSPYTLDLTRQGSKVTESLTVRLLPKSSKWNINYAYTEVNQVNNKAAFANKSGVMTVKDTVLSTKPLYVFIWVDEWTTGLSTCYVGGGI